LDLKCDSTVSKFAFTCNLYRYSAAYYSRGSFYGRAAGLLMYDIAHDTHKDSLDKHFPLWMAIVSLTDQYVHQRLSHESYTAGVMELATQVSNLPGADAPSSRVLEEGTVGACTR
jgi:cell division control protein 45